MTSSRVLSMTDFNSITTRYRFSCRSWYHTRRHFLGRRIVSHAPTRITSFRAWILNRPWYLDWKALHWFPPEHKLAFKSWTGSGWRIMWNKKGAWHAQSDASQTLDIVSEVRSVPFHDPDLLTRRRKRKYSGLLRLVGSRMMYLEDSNRKTLPTKAAFKDVNN